MENHLFFMGKLTISMAIFNSYVKLPEGTYTCLDFRPLFLRLLVTPILITEKKKKQPRLAKKNLRWLYGMIPCSFPWYSYVIPMSFLERNDIVTIYIYTQ